MMINKRLINSVSESKKYIAANVIFQWLSLISNICMIFSITNILQQLFTHTLNSKTLTYTAIIIIVSICIRFICTVLSSKMSFLASKTVKRTLREKIYTKLLRLGSGYNEKISSSEIVQVAVEGVDQLETYFGAYQIGRASCRERV